jgi:hypothetical protein
MIKPIQAIIRILQGKIILNDGTDVRIRKRTYPIDKTPCITIDNSGGTSVIQKHVTNKDYIIPENHPQYDQENPTATISQQVIREERNITLDLNVWFDNEDQRDELEQKILQQFRLVESDHYTHCQQYTDGDCQTLDAPCKVTTSTMRGIKQQCPKPTLYKYQNIFNAYDIIRASFDVAPPYILDDNTTNPPVLRSIIRVSFSYYEYYRIGGAVSETLTINEELV